MSWTPRCILLRAALFAASIALLVVGQARATTVTSTISLGGAGNIGTFSGAVTLGSGSQLQLGASAIAGSYQEVVTGIGFSAQNQTANLSLSAPVSVITNSNQGTANLSYDNFTPGTPETLNSFSSVLSGNNVTTNMTINSSAIAMSTSLGTFNLTPTFSGTIKNISFTSTGSAAVSGGSAQIAGNYSVTLNGSVTGQLSLAGILNVSVGTLYTLPTDTVVTFAGTLPVGVLLSDTGVPFGGGLTTADRNTMLAAFGANLAGMTLPFQFVAPLATSVKNSVSFGKSGLTSIKIQNTTLVANLNLNSVTFNETGTVASALVPEPSSMVLGGMALVGLVGLVARRRRVAR